MEPATKIEVNPELIVDMSKSNSWAEAAFLYIHDEDAAKKYNEAKETLKRLLPADATAATGHTITVYRTKNQVRFRHATDEDKAKARKVT